MKLMKRKPVTKFGNNEVLNEPFTLINLSSGYAHKGSVSEGEEMVCSVKPLVVKEKSCRTDSELKRFGVIKYKINTAVTKATEDGKKNETLPHDAPASITKNDTPLTGEAASVTKDDDSPVTKPMEPASVTKDNTPVIKPTDAEKNGAPAPVMSSPTATAPENELNPVDDSKECRDNKDGDVNTFVPHVMSSPTATAPENELNPVDDSKECRDNKDGDVNMFVPHVMSSPTATTPGKELDPVDVNVFVPHGIKLYYCKDCPDTFWTERGLQIHGDSHARAV